MLLIKYINVYVLFQKMYLFERVFGVNGIQEEVYEEIRELIRVSFMKYKYQYSICLRFSFFEFDFFFFFDLRVKFWIVV